MSKENKQDRIIEIDAQIAFSAGEQVRLMWKIADLNAQVQRHANTVLKLNRERAMLVEGMKP